MGRTKSTFNLFITKLIQFVSLKIISDKPTELILHSSTAICLASGEVNFVYPDVLTICTHLYPTGKYSLS